jgi:predicted metal-dependent phosphoesterase TrpH
MLNAESWIRADFHCHTRLSADALTSPAELIERATAAGIDRIAITDHGEIDGALAAHALDPARIIVGEEIRCRGGTELIGLYLHERIPYGLTVEETAARIRAQGGLVYAPHPYAYIRHPAHHAERALAVADIVEVFNSRAFLPAWNRLAREAAANRGTAVAASSDGHFPHEIGRAYTTLPWFDDAESLRAALAYAAPHGIRAATPFVHVASLSLKAARLTAATLVGRRQNLERDEYHPSPRGAT